MKAFIFTLDAIFALTIAIIGISILLIFPYSSQVPYPIHYSNAQAVLVNLASSKVESIQNSSTLAKTMANQFMGMNETSPQFLGGIQRNSSNSVGPLEPILSYTYNPGNTITTGVVADYGNIYFVANTMVFAVNATTNLTVWKNYVVNSIVSTPALYSGFLFYANTTNLTAVNAKTGNVVWSTNSIATGGITPLTSPITVYDNEVLFGGSDNNVHAYYANNGTSLWSAAVGSKPVSISVLRGNLAVKTAANTIAMVVQTSNTANQLVSTSYSITNAPSSLVGAGTVIYFGSASSANAIYTNGTTVSGFPVPLDSAVTGVANYKNYSIYQTSTGVNAISPSGSSYWNTIIPNSYGTAPTNATPVISGSMVYTLWSNGLAGQNLTTGTVQWFSLIPNVKTSPYMALAYGRLYVTANNEVLAYGSCAVPLHASILSAVATLYFNYQKGCSSALLNAAYPTANYSFFTTNAITRVIGAASFSGSNSFISAKNTYLLNTSYVSVSFWVNVSQIPPNGVRLVNYGDNGTCISPNNYCGWFVYLTNNGMIQFNVMNGAQFSVNGPILQTNKWYQITGVYNGSDANLFINSNLQYSTPKSGVIGITSPNINLTIGTGMQYAATRDTRYFTGNIADLQIYRLPLSTQQVSQLYIRGAQGVPLKGVGLVAWYPLSSDTDDYAMFNTGYANGMSFVTKNYTSPGFSNAQEVTKASAILPIMNYTNGATNTVQVGVYSWS